MTATPSSLPIVVGVDGSKDSSAAVRFAAHEAQLVDARVHLVHVPPTYMPLAPMLPLLPDDLAEAGRAILRRAEEQARGLLPPAHVTSELLDGPRVPTLVQAASESRMIVLGHERRTTVDRLLTGATVTGVAAGSTAPVVSVPPDWSAEDERRCVLVGVRSTDQSHDLLRLGFETAARRGAQLLVVQAWELPHPYDDLVGSSGEETAWDHQARYALERSAAAAHEGEDEVPVDVRVVRGQAARVLLDAAEEADVVILARRRHAFLGRHLGATARALLRESHRPVLIIPPGDPREPAEERLAAHAANAT